MKFYTRFVLYAILALAAQNATAGMMMCGSTTIEDGQLEPVTAEQVLAACGEPTYKEAGQWVYARPGELTKTLNFDSDGNLQSIDVEYSSE